MIQVRHYIWWIWVYIVIKSLSYTAVGLFKLVQSGLRLKLYIFFYRYVRIPFEIRSPQFFILIHDKLATLKIDGRDMSVKFPEQFNIALNGKCQLIY